MVTVSELNLNGCDVLNDGGVRCSRILNDQL